MNDDAEFIDPPPPDGRPSDEQFLDEIPPYWLQPRELPPDDGPTDEVLPLEIPDDEPFPDDLRTNDVLPDEWSLDGYPSDDELLIDMPSDFGDDDPLESPPTQNALNADALSALVDGIVTVDELISRAHATRALLIDQARAWSEVTARSVVVLGPPHTDAEVQDLARRSFTWELSSALRIPESTASSLISDSETLAHQLPATLEALAEGQISYRHAQAMVDQVLTLPSDARADFEEKVLPAAKSLTAAKFTARARKLRERTHPESITNRKRTAFERRRMEFQADLDGMAWINLYQPAATAVAFYNSVRAEAMALQRDDEPRTLTQLSLDVAVDHLLESVQQKLPLGAAPRLECGCPAPDDGVGCGAGRVGSDAASADAGPACADADPAGANIDGSTTPTTEVEDAAQSMPRRERKHRRGGALRGFRPTVIVTVPVMTLLGKSDEPAELEGYGPIDPETARQLAGEAKSFMRLLVHPETGVPLSLGRDKYKVPKDLRLALELRDGTCRGYGCNRSAAECDIDHTVDWQFAGKSDYVNLASLCPPHHKLKHQTAWTVKQTGGGFLEWTSPLKRKYVTAPEVVLPIWPPETTSGQSDGTESAPF
ncbi:HNH endonuclease signature motif containing protein [Mycetocola zhadangensis]|uniref:HNH endonuclease n=1 Tax=Mycetocola zhadangensis TaxID=1164595 RepID=A0A3L7ISW0_9MICO|nr:HNH endonuclease signature motif containing protein [Mycetocola zhadangensis]RLQ81328.1 HNH endonuclease [Mycetocola zhadangensis]GGF02679.1 hypothetical protein GCM10011313_27250 [Mycetocola zhadangensis]